MQAIVTVLVWGVTVYAVFGLGFAAVFVIRGVEKVDPAAVGATWGFKLLIVPGAAALWPGLLRRWLRGAPPPSEHSPHRDRVAS